MYQEDCFNYLRMYLTYLSYARKYKYNQNVEQAASALCIKNKKGRNKCTNYGELSLTNSVSGLYGKIIRNRIECGWKDTQA